MILIPVSSAIASVQNTDQLMIIDSVAKYLVNNFDLFADVVTDGMARSFTV